jgi:hypothetical protein
LVSQAGSTGSSARAVTLALPAFGQENEQKQSLWQTKIRDLTLVQEGPMVWGTFDYHGGRVIGSMHGGKLYGYCGRTTTPPA